MPTKVGEMSKKTPKIGSKVVRAFNEKKIRISGYSDDGSVG